MTDWAAVEGFEPEAAVLCNRSDVKRCPRRLDLLLVLHGKYRVGLHFPQYRVDLKR